MIKALLFDMDGVLADTEGFSAEIGKEYFKAIGVDIETKDFAPYLGCGEYPFFMGIVNERGIKDFDYKSASAFFRSHFENDIKRYDVALPGAKGVIAMAKKAGMMVAIASSAPRWKVWVNIDAVGIPRDQIDFVATGEDIKRNKPFGDIYTLAMISLGLDSSECLVIEDTKGGVRAGKSAGARVLALATTTDVASLFDAGADAVISSLAAIPSFSTIEELNSFLLSSFEIDRGAIKYGANYIAVKKRRISDDELIDQAIRAAWRAFDHAYAQYSNFKVGAAIVSAATGKIYSGCNVENASFGATICAERGAIVSAVAAEGRIGIEKLVVVSDDSEPALPCAACLQVISEFAKPETEIIVVAKNGKRMDMHFVDLLPHPFIFK